MVDGSRICQPASWLLPANCWAAVIATNVSSWIPSSLRSNLCCFWLVLNINAWPFIDSYSHYAYITLHNIKGSIVSAASQKQWTQKETVQCCESSNWITTSLFVCCDHPGEWSSVLTEVGDSGSRNVPNTDNYTVEGHGRSARNTCRGGLFFKMSLMPFNFPCVCVFV